jgi:DHA2 family multidrug resistance protein
VDLRLLKDRNFFLATLTMFMLGFVMYGSTALLPIFLQTLLGYTAMLSGLVLSPGGLIVIVMLPLVGKLLTHFDARWLVIVGVVIVAASLFHMATFNLDIDFRTAMMARVYQSAGMAFLFVPINVMAFYFIPKEKFNNATGIINLARNIGGSFGIANVVTLLARRTQFHQGMLVSHMTPFDSAYQGLVNGAARILYAAGSSYPDAQVQANGMAYGVLQRHATMLAFVDDFWLMGLTFLSLIPLMFLMKKSRPHGATLSTH